MNIHDLIDQFVKVVDPSATLFRRVENAPWIYALEQRVPQRLPVSFLSLITRYAFSAFATGGIHFFANTGGDALDELTVAIFNDKNITNVTHAANFIQFGRPEDGSYDPNGLSASSALSKPSEIFKRRGRRDRGNSPLW
ncbi:MAG TPA: hypothetical protein VFS77_19680 [Pyrinomonadaceae bacterium]|nr:hypothetical protein [Pyrinomonadaceae bacterium]